MNRRGFASATLCSSFFALCLSASAAAADAPAVFGNETLRYTLNWPGGVTLGESVLESKKRASSGGSGAGWEFALSLDGGIPGFQISDSYHSETDGDLCSVEFVRRFSHGERRSDERTTFNSSTGVATRETTKGGKSELTFSRCPKDALAFLQFVRRELSQGRIPPQQTVFFGGQYDLRLVYSGRQTVALTGGRAEADRFAATVKGRSSEVTFELFFALDPARALLLVRVPLPLGAFTMELVR